VKGSAGRQAELGYWLSSTSMSLTEVDKDAYKQATCKLHDNKDLNYIATVRLRSPDAARSFIKEDENHAYHQADDAELKLTQSHAPPKIIERTRRSLSKSSLLCLNPDGINLCFYLLNFLLVSAAFVVRDLCSKFVDFLLILPELFEREREVEADRGC